MNFAPFAIQSVVIKGVNSFEERDNCYSVVVFSVLHFLSVCIVSNAGKLKLVV